MNLKKMQLFGIFEQFKKEEIEMFQENSKLVSSKLKTLQILFDMVDLSDGK